MRVSASHSLGDLARDLSRGATTVPRKGSAIVRRNVKRGEKLARAIARRQSGPHGKLYYKRITGEMTGELSGEYGPTAGGTPVGAGYRHGPGNTDLEKSLDVIVPAFHKQIDGMLDDIFWPGSDR